MASRLRSATQLQLLNVLRVEGDDFSYKISHLNDPMFWIRIERPIGDTLRISDLNPGQIPQADASFALAHLLTTVGFGEHWILLDIFPGWQAHPSMAVELERRMSTLKSVVVGAVQAFDNRSVGFELRRDRDKYDLHCILQ